MAKPDIQTLRQNFLHARQALAAAQKHRDTEAVENYHFNTRDPENNDQTVTLSELFADKTELIVVHNMGISCTYCTLWADGLNGVYEHLTSRAAVVISSPDSVQVQQDFKASRGWRFTMVSTANNTFAKDMGYQNAQGHHPGVSVFLKNADSIIRVADTPFGPGDDFCAVWHLFDLLPDGVNGWQPKLCY